MLVDVLLPSIIKHVKLAAIAGTTIQLPYLKIRSLQLIWMSGTLRLNITEQTERGPFYIYELTLIPSWIDSHILYKVLDEITLSIHKLQRCKGWGLGMDK